MTTPLTLESTWETRELPLLIAIVSADDAGMPVDMRKISDDLGLDADRRANVLRSLIEDGYLLGHVQEDGSGRSIVGPVRPTAKARRATGKWPAEGDYEDFLRVLDERLGSETDAATRDRLRGLRDALTTSGLDVMRELLKSYLKRRLGLEG